LFSRIINVTKTSSVVTAKCTALDIRLCLMPVILHNQYHLFLSPLCSIDHMYLCLTFWFCCFVTVVIIILEHRFWLLDFISVIFPRIYVMDPYKRLGISREASEDEFRAAENFLISKYAGQVKHWCNWFCPWKNNDAVFHDNEPPLNMVNTLYYS